MSRSEPVIQENDPYVLIACGCLNMSIICARPQCFGISIKNECGCCLHECCYMHSDPMTCFDKDHDHIMRIGCICDSCTIKYPKVICKHRCHTCCSILSCSIPSDMEVPCMGACCFCLCYPTWAHCYRISQVNESIN